MRRLRLFLPLALFLTMGLLLFKGLWLDPNEMPSALIDKPLPEFSVPSLQAPDTLIERADLVGEVALVNVWATWCPACQVEHPYLMTLAEQERVPIIGIDYKDDREDALRWLAELGNPYRVTLFDEQGRLGIDLGVFGAPETYLIDHRGVIRYKHIGVVDEKVWQTQLQPLVQRLRREAGQ